MEKINTQDLYKLGAIIELKGNFYLEKKGKNGIKPTFNIMSARFETIDYLKDVLDYHAIKYNHIIRIMGNNKEYQLIRISYNINLYKFFNLIDKYIKFKSDNYIKVYDFVNNKIKNKNGKKRN